jgi:hypothetical protein
MAIVIVTIFIINILSKNIAIGYKICRQYNWIYALHYETSGDQNKPENSDRPRTYLGLVIPSYYI